MEPLGCQSHLPEAFAQSDYRLRLDWGPMGARATHADIAVVVDVLSFSTSVCIAVERGMRVFPYELKGAGAEAFAAQHDAALAIGRLEAIGETRLTLSLSPAVLLECDPVERLVLPSPNGSSIVAALSKTGATVAVGCLRNAQAVVDWLAPRLESGAAVAVIAAGERWAHDDSLRPALEDHLGAGAILSALAKAGFGGLMSPESLAAAALFDATAFVVEARLRDCVGGRELTGKGFGEDVVVAADLNSSCAVPVLTDGSFAPAN